MRKFLTQVGLSALLLGFLCLLADTAEAGPFRRRAMNDSYSNGYYGDSSCACGSGMYYPSAGGSSSSMYYPSTRNYTTQVYPYGNPGQYNPGQTTSLYSPQYNQGNTGVMPNPMPSREVTKIRFSDNALEPGTLTIPVGTTVRWINDTKQPQTITSVRGDFESGDILPGKEFTATFNQPGTFDYSSRMQKDLKGSITVK